VCLEPHDLIISKLFVGREKDLEFATALIRAELVTPELLVARAALLDQPQGVVRRVQDTVIRCSRAAGYG
jgi:hypothetical protein